MLATPLQTNSARILAISGSGRKGSFNTALLKAAMGLLPEGVSMEIHDVSRFPLYDPDAESQMPPMVKRFKEKVRAADAIVFATPEYNHSISAVLKNAIEWGNRPWGDNSWKGKPAAIVSASTSLTGGARAQEHLRQIMVDLDMHPLNHPQVLVAKAHEKFSQGLILQDETTKELVKALLAQLLERTRIAEVAGSVQTTPVSA
ncbi:MAG: NAD(P)H-dependent oxidoreductase [archaeon]|nr:MAG: NAD(P)H-dependent oxidoreductase [archaeon]